MSNKFIYKHRRGSTEVWSKSDTVLLDGEIAIEDCGGGRRGILIGDGERKYSELPKIYLHEVMTKTTTISLPAENWEGDASPYSQLVTIDGVTEYSKIDLQATPELLEYLQNEDIMLTASNDGGVIVVYAINYKPEQDIQVQATVTETKSS